MKDNEPMVTITEEKLFSAASSTGAAAAGFNTVAMMLRRFRLVDGHVHLSVEMRDKLCNWLDESAEILEDLSQAALVDAEEFNNEYSPRPLRSLRGFTHRRHKAHRGGVFLRGGGSHRRPA